jgi:hypothetical protein
VQENEETSMTSFYNKQHLKNTVAILKDLHNDLENWSVNNDDKYNEEIFDIKEAIDNLKKKIK